MDKEREFIARFKKNWVSRRKMYIQLSLITLKKLIQSLNSRMGHNKLHSLFLKNASDEFLNVLVILLNACFTHCYLPNGLLMGLIYPTVKDMKGNSTELVNYRPLM